MANELGTDAPNVITEHRLVQLMQQGYLAEVVCKSAAFRKSAVWYGRWFIRAVDKERSVEKLLVVSRGGTNKNPEIKVREFKTINGLTSFLADLGCSQVDVPLLEGGRTTHSLPNEKG